MDGWMIKVINVKCELMKESKSLKKKKKMSGV